MIQQKLVEALKIKSKLCTKILRLIQEKNINLGYVSQEKQFYNKIIKELIK